MIQKYDSELGKKVQLMLIGKGLEKERLKTATDTDEHSISQAFSTILKSLGLTTSEFDETPARVAKLFCREVFDGLDYSKFPACTLIAKELDYGSPIPQKNINVMSFCEHHFLPFEGTADISFIPKNNQIIGLSNLDKIVNFFSRRPQIQERLTAQIFETLKFLLNTDDVIVKINAKHSCVSLRGQNTNNTLTETIVSGGRFK